jgi:hypothetical protein
VIVVISDVHLAEMQKDSEDDRNVDLEGRGIVEIGDERWSIPPGPDYSDFSNCCCTSHPSFPMASDLHCLQCLICLMILDSSS